MEEMLLERFLHKLGIIVATILSDMAEFADSLYTILIITCLIGIYLKMFGVEEKGNKISSISFLSYLIIKVMASAYGK